MQRQDGSTFFDFGYYDVAGVINRDIGVAAVVYLCEELDLGFGATAYEDPPIEGIHTRYEMSVIAHREYLRQALEFLASLGR